MPQFCPHKIHSVHLWTGFLSLAVKGKRRILNEFPDDLVEVCLEKYLQFTRGTQVSMKKSTEVPLPALGETYVTRIIILRNPSDSFVSIFLLRPQ